MILTSVCLSLPLFFILCLSVSLSSSLTGTKPPIDDSERRQLSEAWTGHDEVLLTSLSSSLSTDDVCRRPCNWSMLISEICNFFFKL